MSKFNLANNHHLIPNANQYFLEKKYVSIHSEDRNVTKYPNSSEFEIELPEDYTNVVSAKLSTWSFPSNYDVFSIDSKNVTMYFKFMKLYNPGEVPIGDPLLEAIFTGLYNNQTLNYQIIIEPGFYNPLQMATELTNKFNEAVTDVLVEFFTNNSEYNYALPLFVNGYDRFKIVYNDVSQKLWFGNTADQFEITNDFLLIANKFDSETQCHKPALPNYSDWGLPYNLGFTRENFVGVVPEPGSSTVEMFVSNVNVALNPWGPGYVPRFYYGDVGVGDNGFWLLPNLQGASVYYLTCPKKINFMGPSYIYMEIPGLNCIDETSPYDVSCFTIHTNETNGISNAAFAKIPVTSTPISQYFDQDMIPYKYFNPPAERIRRLRVKFRYHNGQLVDFSSFDYSFTLEFSLLRPQSERGSNIKGAYDLLQLQTNPLSPL